MLVALALSIADPGLVALAEADRRVAETAFRLQTANVGQCRDVAALPGFSMHALAQYDGASRSAALATFGLSDAPAVLALVPGSDAARAGLHVGDTLAAINDRPVPRATRAGFDQIAETEDALAAALEAGPVRLSVLRGGQAQTIVLAGDRGCESRVHFVPGPALDAGADGRYIRVLGGMMVFVADDTELAIVIAHELAHNILGHRAKFDAAGVSRGLFAGIGRGGAALRASETEADVLSVTLLASAGYETARIVPFWQRLRARVGGLSGPSHPGWRVRIAAVVAAVARSRPK